MGLVHCTHNKRGLSVDRTGGNTDGACEGEGAYTRAADGNGQMQRQMQRGGGGGQ